MRSVVNSCFLSHTSCHLVAKSWQFTTHCMQNNTTRWQDLCDKKQLIFGFTLSCCLDIYSALYFYLCISVPPFNLLCFSFSYTFLLFSFSLLGYVSSPLFGKRPGSVFKDFFSKSGKKFKMKGFYKTMSKFQFSKFFKDFYIHFFAYFEDQLSF